jgi:hypothetical protein
VAYSEQTWVNGAGGETPLSATRLNFMETGIDAAHDLVDDHIADTTSVHGIADTSVLATATTLATAVSDHSADTTSVHGITNTANVMLVTLADAKGDLLVGTAADTIAKLTVGTNGYVLTAASGQTAGMEWAAPAAAPTAVTANTQTGTTYTLVLTDAGKLVTMSNASASTLTVPPNGTVAFPTGSYLTIAQLGAGLLTIEAGVGVTIRSLGSSLVSAGQYASLGLVKLGTNEWLLSGSTA